MFWYDNHVMKQCYERRKIMDISKKDLLKETGISYGQLYRWKREGLIPEAWFIKKSSYTGQETFFPREKILKRIKAIQQLKDKYSLEELANMLAPEITNRTFTEEDLEKFEEIDVDVAACFMDHMEKDEFTFVEILVMMTLSEWRLKEGIPYEDLDLLIENMIKNIIVMKDVEKDILLLDIEQKRYIIFISQKAGPIDDFIIYLDKRMKLLQRQSLSELSNTMKIKYQQEFKFEFDEEESI